MMEEIRKDELVQFMRWNSTASEKVLRGSTKEELIEWIEDKGLFEKFMKDLDLVRKYIESENRWRNIRRAIR